MSMSLDDLLARLRVGEEVDFEVKESAGGFPLDFWPTYSSFANTQGGVVVLGVRQVSDGAFELVGLTNPDARRQDLWNQLQNPEKVSLNLLTNSDVAIEAIDGSRLLVVRVPQATRRQRPVYINGNPLRGTYKRGFQGDYHCDEDEVRRMLRDASDDVFDLRVLPRFGLEDLDPPALSAYKNRLRAREADHPWLSLDDRGFLEQLGGWRKDRDSGEQGLTLGGLLMFGKESALAEALPHFRPDYQERLTDDPEVRWTHRITPDGRWQPNLFNFYSAVIQRLTHDIDVPFKLDGAMVRLGETHVHEALREALVNSLIHADHSSSRNILVVKGRRGFVFGNPGRLRLPLEQVYAGGVSDCRNPNLQKMFFLMGAGERAGSGVGKILRAWREQDWLMPVVRDRIESERTECWLPTVSMIPAEVIADLEKRFGAAFRSADELERTAVVLAHQFGSVTNVDLQRYRGEHPADIGKTLRTLVERGWLSKHQRGRGTTYRLRGRPSDARAVLPFLNADMQQSEAYMPHTQDEIQQDDSVDRHLKELSKSARQTKRASSQSIDDVVVELCTVKPLNVREIAILIGRKASTVSVHYLPRLLRSGRLRLLYPDKPRRRDQAYVAPSERA